MSDQKSERVMLTQFNENLDKNGKTYFYGQIGMLNVSMFQSKTNPQKWNVYLNQKEKKPDNGFNQATPDDTGFNF